MTFTIIRRTPTGDTLRPSVNAETPREAVVKATLAWRAEMGRVEVQLLAVPE